MVVSYEVVPVVIDVERWIHGEDSSRSFLRRHDDGKQCCLGFSAEACGVLPSFIRGITTPAEVANYGELLSVRAVFQAHHLLRDEGSVLAINSAVAHQAMHVNDVPVSVVLNDIRGPSSYPMEGGQGSEEITRRMRTLFPGVRKWTRGHVEVARRDLITEHLKTMGFIVAFINIPAHEHVEAA